MPYHGTIPRHCQQCGKEFFVHPCHLKMGYGTFCSHACQHAHRRLGIIERTCQHCGGAFSRPAHVEKRGPVRFCSRECRDAARATEMSGEKNPNWKGGRQAVTCQHCGKVTLHDPCLVRNGRQYCSARCHAAAMAASGSFRGEANPNWKGGVTQGEYPRQSAMATPEYKAWRSAVFARDGYRCQMCGQRGGRLHAHHVETWVNAPEKRYDERNGVTLCRECHWTINHNGPALVYKQESLI